MDNLLNVDHNVGLRLEKKQGSAFRYLHYKNVISLNQLSDCLFFQWQMCTTSNLNLGARGKPVNWCLIFCTCQSNRGEKESIKWR